MTESTRIALVTGASRGLGLVIAGVLGRRGYHLVIGGRDPDALAAAAGMEEEIQNHIKKLKSRDATARKDAADAIAKVGQIKASVARPAVQPLIEALGDKDARVRAAAASACRWTISALAIPI